MDVKHVFLSVSIAFISVFSFADNGWQAIKENDHIKARQIFENHLKTDSTDRKALQGLIYLSELEEDELNYSKYINTYIRNNTDHIFWNTFQDMYEGDTKTIINTKEYSIASRLTAIQKSAIELWEKKKVNDAKNIFRSVVHDFKWHLLGPYENHNGRSHELVFAPELQRFDTETTFVEEVPHPIKWFLPAVTDPSGIVFFEDYLNYLREGNTYYATTFFENKQEQEVDFRLNRGKPIKVWLDDQLIYTDNNLSANHWDNEIIRFNLPAGNHRLLVKLSDYSPFQQRYSLLVFNDDPFDDDGNFSESQSSFCIRITDNEGNLLPTILPISPTSYSQHNYDTKVISNKATSHIKSAIEKSPDDLFLYYMLCKRLISQAAIYQAEEYFYKLHLSQPDLTMFRHLSAKCFSLNGKIEKSYNVLGEINHDKTPIFALLFKKFKELDPKSEEEKWLGLLKQMEEITPSNYNVISAYIDYFDRKGLDEERESYAKEMSKKFPALKNYFESVLANSSNKPRKQATRKEKDKQFKADQKRIKAVFDYSLYNSLIRNYKDRGNFNKVISLYDELLSFLPYDSDIRYNKANYLYQFEKYDLALEEIEKGLLYTLYDYDLYELAGDIYFDKKEKEKAKQYYNSAWLYSTSSYNRSSVKKKIEKIEEPKKYKQYFETKSFDETIADTINWSKAYPGEDAVVLLFTRDLIADSTGHNEIYQKIVIKILTERGVSDWTQYRFNFMGFISMAKVIKPNGSEIRPDVSGSQVVCKDLSPGDLLLVEGIRKSEWSGELGKEMYFYNYLSFQAPLHYAKVELAFPLDKPINYLLNKLDDNITVYEKEGFRFYKWEFHKVSEPIREEALVDEQDMHNYIMVSTLNDWNKVANWYLDKTYRLLEPTYDIVQLLDSIVTPQMTDKQKATAIYNYITREIRYSYVGFLQSNYIPKLPGLTCSAKIGDCKDVSSLMITMLRYLGIESYYVLVKTSNMFHADILPSLYFDHVIVGYDIDGISYYADLTTDYYPQYVLTDLDVDAVALKIDASTSESFRLPKDHLDPLKNKADVVIDAYISEDRSVSLALEAHYPGMAGGRIRELFARFTEEEKKNYIIDNLGNGIFNHLELDSYEIANLKAIDEPLHLTIKAKAYTYTNSVLDFLIFRVPFETTIQFNPIFSGSSRQNAIDLKKVTGITPVRQVVKIHLPKGYTLVKKPKGIHFNTIFGVYQVDYSLENNIITVNKYQQFDRSIIPVEEFDLFKKYYLELLDADALLIPVKK